MQKFSRSRKYLVVVATSLALTVAVGCAGASQPQTIADASPALPTGAHAALVPTAATTVAEPSQKDDYPSFASSWGVFMFDDELLPGLTSLVYFSDEVQVGPRAGRRIDVVIQAEPPSNPPRYWMLTGALRTDSEGTQYVRAKAVVNGDPAEVAVYGKDAIFECDNGYRVIAGIEKGWFDYDEKNPGVPWESAAE